MDFNHIINFMSQQLKALKEIEDLLAHNEKQAPTHSIKPEDIEALKFYVATMKLAATTAEALAKHYKNAENAQSPKAGQEQPVNATETEEAKTSDSPVSEVAEPKKKRSPAKKQDAQKAEPADEPSVEEAPSIENEFDFLD